MPMDRNWPEPLKLPVRDRDKYPRCAWCSRYFQPRYAQRRYCSTVCSQRASYDRHRKKKFPKTEKICLGCGQTYLPNSSAQKCCKTCLPNKLAGLRWQKYRLTQPEYDELLELQGGVCAICKLRPPKAIDHDHVSGHVRGLLCYACNHAIGVFLDDPLVIRRALDYVEGFRKAFRGKEVSGAS
jgi:hypothetical protein